MHTRGPRPVQRTALGLVLGSALAAGGCGEQKAQTGDRINPELIKNLEGSGKAAQEVAKQPKK